MVRSFVHGTLLLVLLGINPMSVQSACASLGGDAASVRSDAYRLHGVVQSTLLQQYEIQEIRTDSGVRVREFLNRDGSVFAVSWLGPVMPDLQGLLGESFESFAKAVAALNHPGLKRALRITSSELVVESGGHLRAYTGRAYLPALIPTGTSTADLR
jgi:hypothetical protein